MYKKLLVSLIISSSASIILPADLSKAVCTACGKKLENEIPQEFVQKANLNERAPNPYVDAIKKILAHSMTPIQIIQEQASRVPWNDRMTPDEYKKHLIEPYRELGKMLGITFQTLEINPQVNK